MQKRYKPKKENQLKLKKFLIKKEKENKDGKRDI